MKTLIIDNFDSFTYNLFQYLGELGGKPFVKKNNEISLETIREISPTHIVISPGPGTVAPNGRAEDFGICTDVIRELGLSTPLLGVCLGHQGIIKAFGGRIETAKEIMHGKPSVIEHDKSALFKNVPNPFSAMRYHSLCGSAQNFPNSLKICAREQKDQTIMAVQHVRYPIFGIQFHPESFGTSDGKIILSNFLQQ